MPLSFSTKKKGIIEDITTQVDDMRIEYMDVLPQLETLNAKQADAIRTILMRIDYKRCN